VDADDDSVLDRRFFNSAEVARSCQLTDFAKERLKTLAILLSPKVEDVALVHNIDSAGTEGFECSNNWVQLLSVVGVLKLHRYLYKSGKWQHAFPDSYPLGLTQSRNFHTAREIVTSRLPCYCH